MDPKKPVIGKTERAHAKGPIGDELLDATVYVDTPAVDALYAIAVQLAAALWTTRDRLSAIEALLKERQILSEAEIELYRVAPEEEGARVAERDKFIADIFRAVKAL